MRLAHAEWWLKLTDAQKCGVWYSDEMAFYIKLKPNVKNDIIYVKKGQQSTTNIQRMHKGDMSQIFSMWWTINKDGVVAAKVYEEKMTVDFFRLTLNEKLKPAISEYSRSRQKLKFWCHDHVTNSSKLYDPDSMNAALGEGRWLQFSPPICREQDGFMTIAATQTRREYQRKKMVPKKKCDCDPTDGGRHVPSSSPDLNLAEYAQGMIRSLLLKAVNSKEEDWTGNAKKKMCIVMRLVNKLNEDKRFFFRLWDGHDARCKKVIASGGDIT